MHKIFPLYSLPSTHVHAATLAMNRNVRNLLIALGIRALLLEVFYFDRPCTHLRYTFILKICLSCMRGTLTLFIYFVTLRDDVIGIQWTERLGWIVFAFGNVSCLHSGCYVAAIARPSCVLRHVTCLDEGDELIWIEFGLLLPLLFCVDYDLLVERPCQHDDNDLISVVYYSRKHAQLLKLWLHSVPLPQGVSQVRSLLGILTPFAHIYVTILIFARHCSDTRCKVHNWEQLTSRGLLILVVSEFV